MVIELPWEGIKAVPIFSFLRSFLVYRRTRRTSFCTVESHLLPAQTSHYANVAYLGLHIPIPYGSETCSAHSLFPAVALYLGLVRFGRLL